VLQHQPVVGDPASVAKGLGRNLNKHRRKSKGCRCNPPRLIQVPGLSSRHKAKSTFDLFLLPCDNIEYVDMDGNKKVTAYVTEDCGFKCQPR
jgi:hypothetical protein